MCWYYCLQFSTPLPLFPDQRTTFTAGFNTRYDADAFEHWVTYKDGNNVVEPLMAEDPNYCGMKVRDDTRVYPLFDCGDGGGSETSDESSSSSSRSDGSPRNSPGGTNYMDDPYTGQTYADLVGYDPLYDDPPADGHQQRAASIGINTALYFDTQTDTTFSAAGVAGTATDAEDSCRTRYQVDWELRVRPGTIAASQDDDDDDGPQAWSREADTHFYLHTSSLVRQIMSDHIPGLAGQPNSLDIRLTGAWYTRDRIRDSGCGRGVMKHVKYRFMFDDRDEAARFRDWVGADRSHYVVDWLERADPAGVCAAEGEVHDISSTWWCDGSQQGGKFVFGGPK